MSADQITGKKVTIVGAARSGVSLAVVLKKRGAAVFVSDAAKSETKVHEAQLLETAGIPFEFGGHSERMYDADYIALSPGVPMASAPMQEALRRNLPVFSEIEVASWICKSPVIAVTGSNGKTTTTTMLGQMLRQHWPNAIVAGNIGTPFSMLADESVPDAWAAVEVSSFQLETISSFHPRVAVIVNLAPNHLDRYVDYNGYIEAKLRVMMNLTANDYLVVNGDDEELMKRTENTPARRLVFSAQNTDADACAHGDFLSVFGEKIIKKCQMKIHGVHNHMNALAAALAARIAGISDEQVAEALKTFAGVEHRLEFVQSIRNVDFINDSKATTVESLAVALRSFTRPVVLIAGGKDKGSDFTSLNELISEHVRVLILIGNAAQKMSEAWRGIRPILFAGDIREAVGKAFASAWENDVVLLSPACSSFDMFDNFEHRGQSYKEQVKLLGELVGNEA